MPDKGRSATARMARPIYLTNRERTLLSIAAELYADEFVEGQFPENQLGAETGWDERDAVCLHNAARRLMRGTDADAMFTAKGLA